MSVRDRYKQALLGIIHKHVPAARVYLFGSRARNQEHPGSDIDIALDAQEPIPYKKLLNIMVEIDDTTIPLKVDIVDFQTAPQDLQEDIIKEGIVWKN